VADLIAAIERFILAWNDRCRPFTWTKDPDTVIAKATDPRRRKVTIQVVSGIQTFPLVSSVRTSKGRRPCLPAVDR
jgi:hypothetical protein